MSAQRSAPARGLKRAEVYDAMLLAAKTASGTLDLPVAAWLTAGFSAWIKAGGDVPLERCLHLPASSKRRQIVRRNAWVRAAADYLCEPSAYRASLVLAREMHRFITRGGWSRWGSQSLPPDTCGELDSALFFIAKANDGKTLSARQLRRILGHVSSPTCPD